MKALYVTSLHAFSGKTAVCLALGRRLQKDGYRVGYFKPLSTQLWQPLPGRAVVSPSPPRLCRTCAVVALTVISISISWRR